MSTGLHLASRNDAVYIVEIIGFPPALPATGVDAPYHGSAPGPTSSSGRMLTFPVLDAIETGGNVVTGRRRAVVPRTTTHPMATVLPRGFAVELIFSTICR